MTDDKSLTIQNNQIAGIEKKIRGLFNKKTPASAIKTRKGAGGKFYQYIPIDYTVNELDASFGIFWEFIVENVRTTPGQIIVRGRLVIKSPDGFSVSRPGVGRANIKFYQGTKNPVDEGNDEKSATSDAIKKAASLFGIGADVYYKEIEKYEEVPDVIDEDEEKKGKAMSRYFATAADRGIDGETAKDKIKLAFNKEHMDELSVDQIYHAVGILEKQYEIVEAGEPPRRINGAPVKPPVDDPERPGPKVAAAAPIEGEVVDNSAVKKRVFEEPGPRAYYCQGPKHKETGIDVDVETAGDWCSEQCKTDYWGPSKDDKQTRFNSFVKNGGKKEA